MWVVQVQKDVVDLSKHYIHEISALVSLDRAKCFALKKKTCKNSYIVVQKSLVYEASISMGFNVQNKFCVSRDLCMCCGPVCLHVLWTFLFVLAADLFVCEHSHSYTLVTYTRLMT